MRNGIPNYNEIVFSEEDKQEIVRLYVQEGWKTADIGSKYQCSYKTILKLLTKLNVTRRRRQIKYSLDEKYFDNIDTQNKAYTLGFLFADGYNSISKFTVSMALQESDGYILDKIRADMKQTKPLEHIDYSNKHDFGYHYGDQVRLLLFSKHLCQTLANWGMVPNKSLVLQFPDIPKKFYRHFIRGYFDGDGSLTVTNVSRPLITVTSTEEFCKKVQEILVDVLQIPGGGIYDASCHNGITKVLSISGPRQCKKVLDWIYKDAELYLQRKYDRYLKLTEYCDTH